MFIQFTVSTPASLFRLLRLSEIEYFEFLMQMYKQFLVCLAWFNEDQCLLNALIFQDFTNRKWSEPKASENKPVPNYLLRSYSTII